MSFTESHSVWRRMCVGAALATYVLALVSGLLHGRTHPGEGAVGWYFSGEYLYPFGSAEAAAALPAGSRLVALNSAAAAGSSTDAIYAHLRTTPGDVNRLRIVRPDGTTAEVVLPVTEHSWARFFAIYRVRLLLGLFFVAVGSVTFSLRPHTMTAWALLPFCLIVACNLFLNALIFYPSQPLTFAYGYEALASGFMAVVAVHLGLVFPVTHPALVRRPRLLWLVYAVGLGLGALALHLRLEGRISKWVVLAPVMAATLAFLIGRSCLLALREGDALIRQRARILLLGCTVGFAPTVVVIMLQSVFAIKWLQVNSVLWSTLALPAALVYLTVRRESVNTRIAIRRGSAYVAGFASAALLGWTVAIALTYAVTGRREPLAWWAVLAGFGMVGTLHAALWQWVNRRLDFWFYPKRAHYADIIYRASRQIQTAPGPLTVLDQLVYATHELCEASSATAFLFPRTGEDAAYFRSTVALEPMDTDVLAQTALMRRLIATQRPVYRDVVASDPAHADIRELALTVFNRLRADLVLPLLAGNTVIGGLAVGRRVSGDGYSRAELEAVQTVVACAAYALPAGTLVPA